MVPETVSWKGDHLEILDQRELPKKVSFLRCTSVEEVARAIETLAVRGAPAIGITAAYGMVLAAPKNEQDLKRACERLERTRPTAVNLFWALKRMQKCAGEKGFSRDALLEEAQALQREDIETNRRIGFWGQTLLAQESVVMTHCNAGALATGGYGTALGVIRAAREQGKRISVIACEARPVLQGARLTAWELAADGFDVTLICDSAAAWVMKSETPDAVVVGADRIAANGDTANKIGTYALALAARRHGIPFYVAAPSSTFDPSCAGGDEIPIETRDAEEVRRLPGSGRVPEEVLVYNPAFDVTPASLITAFFTEAGVLKPPFRASIRRCLEHSAVIRRDEMKGENP